MESVELPSITTTHIGGSPKAQAAGGCETYRGIVSQYNWNIQIAMAVMRAESGCNSDAINYNTDGTTDKGLFQINSIHSDLIGDNERFEPNANIRAAYAVYMGSGWKAWSTYVSGKYQQFL